MEETLKKSIEFFFNWCTVYFAGSGAHRSRHTSGLLSRGLDRVSRSNVRQEADESDEGAIFVFFVVLFSISIVFFVFIIFLCFYAR